MSDTDTAHCRLCAISKPYGKLVNLQTDENRRQKVVQKLFRLSLEVTNFNSPHDSLPKTVCFPCMESLNNAFEFVLKVESCQSELGEFGLVNIKDELLDIDDVSLHEERCAEPKIKIEVDISSETVTPKSETVTEEELAKDNSPIKEDHKEIGENIIEKSLIVDTILSWKDCSWLCAYCDIMFSSVDELKQHSMQSHGCCNPYRCTDCRIRKLNLDSFVKHVKRHRNRLKLSCYKCHKIFLRQYDTIMHEKGHINTDFKCPGCNETFATKEQSLEHCNTYNKDRKIREVPPEHLTDDLKCVFCHKQFRYKGGLTTHLLTQHTEKKRDHTCDKCGKCFLNKANLTAHMLMHDDIRPYVCEICKHCFRQRSQLSRHMGVHDGKKPFACNHCGRCFRLKKQLSTHSIVHTDKFPHICSYCQKGFKHKSTFVQHERLHTGERPYTCQVCHHEFTNWPNYNKHMKRRHGMNMAKSQQSPESLLNPNTTEFDMHLQSKIKFVPKRRGRPKTNKSNINANKITKTNMNAEEKLPTVEIKQEKM